MSMYRLVLGLFLFTANASAEVPQLGEPVDESEVNAITVFADGAGLPQGQGSVAEGRLIYERQCIACHGVGGQGGINDQLVGGHVGLEEIPQKRTIGSYWPYAVPVFDYIRRAMPYANPGSLTNDQIYALTAYLLHANGVVAEDAVLDAESLRAIQMPNRVRFFSDFKLPE